MDFIHSFVLLLGIRGTDTFKEHYALRWSVQVTEIFVDLQVIKNIPKRSNSSRKQSILVI